MIRLATASDIPQLVEFAADEHARSLWSHVEFDRRCAGATIAGFISGFGRTAIRSDGGYLLGFVQPTGFSAKTFALEYVLYATDGAGLALLEKFEEWARSMGAIAVIAHDYIGDDRLANVLERRRGYKRVGTALSLTLEG